jgi:aquaporin Z
MISLGKRCLAEFIGTFWLVLGGCGSAVLAAAFTMENVNIGSSIAFPLGISLVGVSLAFGLTVVTGAYAFGGISGGHFNPAVTLGLWAGKRFPASELLPYIMSQVVGAIIAGALIYMIASGRPGFELSGSNPLASNGFGLHSPGGYSLGAAFIAETILTFMFLMIILGVTDRHATPGFAPLAIGFALTLIHLISIPVTNTSVNPARSTGVALFAGAELISQLWLFWIAPFLGAVVAGWVYNLAFHEREVSRKEKILVQRPA